MLTTKLNHLTILTLWLFSPLVLSEQSNTDELISIVKDNLQTIRSDLNYQTNKQLNKLSFQQLRHDANRIKLLLTNQAVDDALKEKLLTVYSKLKSTSEQVLQKDLIIPDFLIENVPEESVLGGVYDKYQGQIRGSYSFTSSGHSTPVTNIFLYNHLGEKVRNLRRIGEAAFSINNLVAGDYYLVVIALGYQDIGYPNIPCHQGIGNGCTIEDLQPINLATNDSLTGFDFVLEPQRSAYGQITTSDDDSDSYMLIDGYDAADNYLGTTGELFSQFNFELEQMGAYKFLFYTWDNSHNVQMHQNIGCIGQCDLSQADLVAVEDDPVDLGQITLHPTRTISGQLIDDETDLPVTDIDYIDFISATSGLITNRVYARGIAADGSWSVNLLARNYNIRVRSGKYAVHYAYDQNCPDASLESCESVSLTPALFEHDAEQDIEQVELRLVRAGMISGTVIHPQVVSGDYDGDARLYDEIGNLLNSTEIQPDGSYAFIGLGSGNYHVTARANHSLNTAYPNYLCDHNPEVFNSCLNVTGSTQIYLADNNQLSGVDIQLVVAPEIHGTVVNQQGDPLGGIEVSAINQNLSSELTRRAVDITDEFGHFELSNLYYGSFYLQANHRYFENWHTMLYDNVLCQDDYRSCDTTGATELVLNDSVVYDGYRLLMTEKGQLEVSIAAGPSEFEGYLIVYDTAGELIKKSYVNNSRTSLIELPIGDYYLMYQNDWSEYDRFAQYVSTIYGGTNCYESCDPSSGSLIQVKPQSTTAVNLSVDRSHQVNINIVDKPNPVYAELYQGADRLDKKTLYNTSSTLFLNMKNDVQLALTSEGYYLNFFNGVQCADVACGLASGTFIQPVVDGVNQFDTQMQPLTQISGYVHDTFGKPIRVRVSMYSVDQPHAGRTTSSDDQNNGYFELNGVSEGDYHIYVSHSVSSTYTNTFYPNEHCVNLDFCDRTQAQIIHVRKDQFIQDLNFILPHTGSLSIENTRYPDNTPVKDAVFWLYQWNGEHYEYLIQQRLSIYHTDTINKLYQEGYKLMAVQELDELYIKSVYPNIPCSGMDTQSCLSMGDDVQVDFGSNTLIDDFVIAQPPAVDVHVTDQQNGEYIDEYGIRLVRPNGSIYKTETVTEPLDGLRIPLSDESSYFLEITTLDTNPYKGQLYDGFVCDQGLGVDCGLDQGTLINLDTNELRTINISLSKRPELTIRILDDITLQPLEANVLIYDTNESEFLVAENVIGEHTFNLLEGQYYVMVQPIKNGYYAEAFDDIICLRPPIGNCWGSPQLVEVTDSIINEMTIFLDMDDGVGGYVIDADSGLPLSGVGIDLWYQGQLVKSLQTFANGGFSHPGRDYGYYRVSTHVPSHVAYIDEVYDDIQCPDGPAIDGLCEHSMGEQVSAIRTSAILIELESELIFFNGFEDSNQSHPID